MPWQDKDLGSSRHPLVACGGSSWEFGGPSLGLAGPNGEVGAPRR